MMRRVFLTILATAGVAAYFLIPKVLHQPETNGVVVNDLHSFIKPRLAALQLPANVHFTPEGCRALGRQVARSVKAALQ
jgi:hypothetical protein